MSTWQSVSLAEISSKPQYGVIAKGQDRPTGPLLVRQSDIAGGRINWQTVPFCDLDVKSAKRYTLKRGDLLISRLGNGVGNAATVSHDREDAVFAGYLVRFQPNPEKAEAQFVGYQLQSKRWRDHVTSFRSGAAQPTLNAQQMGEFTFLLPPLSEQRAIAATLRALDDKIESNRRIASLIPDAIRARVSAELLRSSVSVPVSELARFVNGGAYTKGASGNGRMVIRIAELNSGPGASTVYNDIEVPEDKTARAGDILMSWSGSLGVYRWFRDEAVINQHIFKVVPTGFPASLVFDRLDAIMPVFRGLAADKATTMGHIQRGHLSSVEVDVPEGGALEALRGAIEPLWQRLLLADQEILRLERLRNALLPELLAGRLTVTEGHAR